MSTNDSLYRGLVSIKGVVCRNGLVALARNHRGEWDLPGGKRENGESFYDCLRREFDEELGLRVTWGRVIDAFPHHYYDDIVVIVVGCNASSTSTLRVSEEHSDVRWFGVGELAALEIPPNYLAAIEQWTKGNGFLPTIVRAEEAHLRSITSLIEKSIRQLCVIDHQNDEQKLNTWIDKRNAENLRKLFGDESACTLVCLIGTAVVGVSHVARSGELVLCYVHPDHVGQGIGALILHAAEDVARSWGLKRIVLESTQTAKRFYLRKGYLPHGEPVLDIGMIGYPLAKHL